MIEKLEDMNISSSNERIMASKIDELVDYTNFRIIPHLNAEKVGIKKETCLNCANQEGCYGLRAKDCNKWTAMSDAENGDRCAFCRDEMKVWSETKQQYEPCRKCGKTNAGKPSAMGEDDIVNILEDFTDEEGCIASEDIEKLAHAIAERLEKI